MAAPSSDQRTSEYNQTSFVGGMNLLSDDTRLQPTQYRVGFNLRNRYDVLDEVKESLLDTAFPTGVVQEITTFGTYIIAFVSGKAYYRSNTDTGWTWISQFAMATTEPRYWTTAVPVSTTNYGRWGSVMDKNSTVGAPTTVNPLSPILNSNSVAASFAGNLPGLLVQDGVNQPLFIYLDDSSNIQCRTTQTHDQWHAIYNAGNGNLTTDEREYVPIGKQMAWVDGVLYIASTDGNTIYRSVSGRPLDFMVNVKTDGSAGGTADSTSYSVGVGGISTLRGMSDGSLFVAASNANFSVSKNMTPSATKEWGEYTFIRKYLFESTCLSDRCIIDSLGDTRFIDMTGVRSFNAVQQLQNEGRNSPFTATIQAAFKGVIQDVAAAILYDNYELYAVNTIFGPAIAVYDTIVGVWAGFDISQTGGKKIKQFAKIELGVQLLYAVTEDNKLYQLYASDNYATATVMTGAISANMLYANQNIKLSNAKNEVKLLSFRCVVNRITQQTVTTVTPVIDNRVSRLTGSMVKTTELIPATTSYPAIANLPNIGTQLTNLYFPTPNCEQGWKVALLLSWNGGAAITQFSAELRDETPLNPLNTRASTK